MENFSLDETIKSITKSIDSIEEYGYKNKLNPEIVSKLYDIREKINMIDTQNQDEIFKYIQEYKKVACEMWKEYLEKNNESGDCRYLIHNIGEREYYDKFRNQIMSTSLITDKHIAFFRQWAPGIPNGFIINPRKITSASPFDNLIDNTNVQDEGDYSMYQLPFKVEARSMEYVKIYDGDILSYSNKGYSDNCNEIVCSDYDIVGYFFLSFGEGSLSPVYDKAKRMAEARNIELKEIDFIELREKNGLPSMNENMKKDLLKNILTTIVNKNKEKDIPDMAYLWVDNQFIEDNFEEFANKYLSLRNTPDFNIQGILEQLRHIILEYEYKKYKEDVNYVIGQGIYVGGLSDSDKKYLEELSTKDRAKSDNYQNRLNVRQMTSSSLNEGRTIDQNSNKVSEDNITDRIKKVRENLESNIIKENKGMNILENYNLKYNFGENYQSRVSNLLNEMLNGSNDLFAEQLQNGQIGNVKSEYAEMLSFIKNVEEYLYYYKDNPNFNNILNSVSSIKKISVLPVNKRGIYGQALAEKNTLLISPVLGASTTLTHEERTRLYVAHELGHIVNHSWQNTVEKFLENRVNKGEMTRAEKELYQEGFSMLDEAITQNNAENFAYAFAGKNRPTKQYKSSRAGIFGNTPYLSNYDFYGEYQMPTAKFAKTLRGIGKYDNDDVALNMLSQRALGASFALDIIDEYNKDNQYENLFSLLKNMGIIKKAGYAAFGYDDRAYIQASQKALNDFNNLADRMREYRDVEVMQNNTSRMPSYQTVGTTSANRATNYQSGLNLHQITPQEISALTNRTINQNPGFLSRSITKVKNVIKKIFNRER